MSFAEMDRIDEFIWVVVIDGWGTLKEVEEQWTIQDMLNAYIIKTRKMWAEEAHAMLMQEQHDKT